MIRGGTTALRFCSRGGKLGLPQNSIKKRGNLSLTKEQGGGQWIEKYQEETSGVSGILAKPI